MPPARCGFRNTAQLAGVIREVTLRGALAATALCAAIIFLALGALVFDQWGTSLLTAAERLRRTASRRAESLVMRTLQGAAAAAGGVARQVRDGTLDLHSERSLAAGLASLLAVNEDLGEVTVTTSAGRRVSVVRGGSDGPGPALRGVPMEPGEDPTADVTYRATLANARFDDDPLFTDLHYSALDRALPESGRRVMVAVMRPLRTATGAPISGVVRVGVPAARLDSILQAPVDASDPDDPHRVLLVDERGRLVAPRFAGTTLEDVDGDLRPSLASLPSEIRAVLAQPAVRANLVATARFRHDGRSYLLSVAPLAGAQGWRVVVLVPEDYYLADLHKTRRMILAGSVGAFAAFALVGALLTGSARRSMDAMRRATARMSAFDFSAQPISSRFRDVDAVLKDLEQAKTALRALGKYVPIALVRQLYQARREPRLGAETRELTILFSDIEDFTNFAETAAPEHLATALGDYLASATAAVHATGGTVDKYVGDSVMAFWNAPERMTDHAARACAAALRFAAEASASSSFRTRIGLHSAPVMVGHFGAADRLSYTAIGDGVNLASRLEGLNKAYGTGILASGAVRDACHAAYSFRLVDRVAVKGKKQAVHVYELLGLAGTVLPERLESARRYELAFADYQAQRFADAATAFEALPQDGSGAGTCPALSRPGPPPAAATLGRSLDSEQ